jgi:hypothetical protein
MTKFIYSYDVVRVVDGLNRAIATGFASKAEAQGLEIQATNNVPGRTFKVRQRRHANPAYVG